MNVRIGIIGTGVGLRTLLPGFRTVRGCTVVALVGSSAKRGEELAREHNIPRAYADYHDLVDAEDVDLVCVATPNPRHYEEVKYALRQGKHVIAEKPLAMTLGETEDLRDLASSVDSIAIVDHQLRFNPYLAEIRNVISEGRLGRVYYVRIHQQSTGFSDPKARWNWSFDAAMGGGVRLAMGSHLVDLVSYWLGTSDFNTVSGTMDVVFPSRVDFEGAERTVEASSYFGAVLSGVNGLTVHLAATAAAFSGARFDVSIYGTDGEIQFDLSGKLRGSFTSNRGNLSIIPVLGATEDDRDNKVSIFKGSFVYLAPLLIRAIAEKDRTLLASAASFDDAVHTQRVLDCIRASASEGRTMQTADRYFCNVHEQ
ncbi:MAG TPA: Gfo/Idh/MocA family oxidoreductase [Armatimonadota bacterium]